MCRFAKFQAKQTTLTFSVQICPKMDLGLGIQKTHVGIRMNKHRQGAMHADFQEKRTTLTFSAKICAKMGFGVGISKL